MHQLFSNPSYETNKARQLIRLPRLASPPKPAQTSRRLRRLTTARPRLRRVRGVERPSHIAGTLPRSHQLGTIAEPIADHLVQQTELLADVRGTHLQIGARAYMLAPACTRCPQRVLVLPERRGELVQHLLRHPELHQELLLRARPLQDRPTHREQPLVRRVRRRHAELLRPFRILGAYHCAHGTQIAEYPGLQRAPELLPLLHGRPLHRHPHPLLGRQVLGVLQQLLELRQPEVLPYSLHLMGPQKVANPCGHLQPPTQLSVHKRSLLLWPQRRRRAPLCGHLPTLVGYWTNRATRFVLRKQMHCPRLWTKKCGSKASRTGNPALSRCPLESCRRVNASLETGRALDEDARVLSENARSLKADTPSLHADARSLRRDPRSLTVSVRARPRGTPNWPSPRHTIGISEHSSEIEAATPGLEERTLLVERASLRIERSSLRLVRSSLH